MHDRFTSQTRLTYPLIAEISLFFMEFYQKVRSFDLTLPILVAY